jgi:hypothetical protein
MRRGFLHAKVREFPVGVVYTLTTGLTFAEFDAIHGAIEYVLGSPVWTHHLALSSLWDSVRSHVAQQYPALVAIELEPKPPREDTESLKAWAERQVAAMEALVGAKRLPVVPLPAGAWNPLHPLNGIPEGATPILVEVDPQSGLEGAKQAAEQIKRIIDQEREGSSET